MASYKAFAWPEYSRYHKLQQLQPYFHISECSLLITFRHRQLSSSFLQPSPGDDAQVNSLAFHRTHDFLVTASNDDAIRVYDTYNGVEQKVVLSKKYGVANICYAHDPHSVIYSSVKVRRIS